MDRICKKSYNEILEILKYIPSEEYEKIPKDKIDVFKKHKDPSYQFEYNPFKSLNEQDVLRETKVLIVGLFRDVVASDVQKERLNIILNCNEKKYQDKLNEKYKYDEIFHKKQKNIKTEEKSAKNTQMIEYKENIFLKIYNAFKRVFNKSIQS